jgi:hypothetical protein
MNNFMFETDRIAAQSLRWLGAVPRPRRSSKKRSTHATQRLQRRELNVLCFSIYKRTSAARLPTVQEPLETSSHAILTTFTFPAALSGKDVSLLGAL